MCETADQGELEDDERVDEDKVKVPWLPERATWGAQVGWLGQRARPPAVLRVCLDAVAVEQHPCNSRLAADEQPVSAVVWLWSGSKGDVLLLPHELRAFGQDDSCSEASTEDLGSPTDLPRLSGGGGHYLPAAAVTGACALHWMPFAEAVSAARALLGVSHEDLRLRAHQLLHELSGAFFDGQAAAAAAARPFAAVCGGAARFPEDGLYVCADIPPLRPALLDVQRALMQVAVKDAGHGPCDWYFDTVGHVMQLLVVGDAGDGRGPAVFDRAKFEVAFALKWVD